MVMINDIDCPVRTPTTPTQIECDVAAGQRGTFQVEVLVSGLGYAQHVGGPHTFEYTVAISTIPVTTCGSGGKC